MFSQYGLMSYYGIILSIFSLFIIDSSKQLCSLICTTSCFQREIMQYSPKAFPTLSQPYYHSENSSSHKILQCTGTFPLLNYKGLVQNHRSKGLENTVYTECQSIAVLSTHMFSCLFIPEITQNLSMWRRRTVREQRRREAGPHTAAIPQPEPHMQL